MMTPWQALANLDAAAGQLNADRETHKALVVSVQVLRNVIGNEPGAPGQVDDIAAAQDDDEVEVDEFGEEIEDDGDPIGDARPNITSIQPRVN